MTALVVAAPAQLESVKNCIVAELEVSATEMPPAIGLSSASYSSTVTTPEHASAGSVCAAVSTRSDEAAPAVTVTVWLAGVRPEVVAVTPHGPALTSLKYTPALLCPAAMLTCVAVMVQAGSEYRAPV